MRIKRMLIFSILFTFLLSLNVNAMENGSQNLNYKTPVKAESLTWTWLDDEVCVYFDTSGEMTIATLNKLYNMGLLQRWSEDNVPRRTIVTRFTYTGKWNQDANGIWSFVFDDSTIPLGPTNIDGIVYAFNGYGQLIEGYNYWGDLKTGADGLVVTDNAEFLQWLSTQYLPECTSHE